jgi:hypothetical protein
MEKLMKKTLIVSTILMTLTSMAFANDLVYSIKAQSEKTLKKVSKKRFEKISESITGTESLDLIGSKGNRNLYTKEINNSDTSAVALEVTGKNIIRVEDQVENISAEVEARVDTSILGNIKAISISGKDLDVLYAASYEKSGLAALKNLNFGNGTVTSKINSSDLKCTADAELLKCTQSQELIFTLKGN